MVDVQDRIAASVLLENNVKSIIEKNRIDARGYRSLAELAKAIDMSAPSLTHALKHNPSLSTIQKIAEALNVPIASLFHDTRKIEGFISIDGNITHFFTEEELKNALKKETPQISITMK